MGKYTCSVAEHLILPARIGLTTDERQLLKLLGRVVPESVSVCLIIDTGAKRSSLMPALIDRLKPRSRGHVRVETSLAAGGSSLHWIRLEFPGTSLETITELAVVRLKLPASLQIYHGIIGRDVLARWEYLLYEGRRSRLTVRDRRRFWIF